MIKRLLQFFLLAIVLIGFAKPVLAKEATLHFFWSEGCPHCAKEKTFLTTLTTAYPELTIKEYEITYSRDNWELLEKLEKELKDITISGVPFTIIGERHFVGYLNDETTGKDIEDAVRCAIKNGCTDLVASISAKQPDAVSDQAPPAGSTPKTITLPFIGDLDVKHLSLPLLTIVIALLDGFNPCAMWTLLFLISLLLGMKDRKRMWILGTAFIVSSAFVYFLFLSAWLNLFLFLGFVLWIRVLIGLVAVGAGIYNIRDYIVNKQGGCAVMGDEKRQKMFDRMRAVTQRKEFFLALGGIILLAVAVNMVELVCSAGLPAIYTNILGLSNLPGWQYTLYLILYVTVFMLDDLFIFFTAMLTLQAFGIQSKYSRFSHLIGGGLMIAIGILLLFKPEVLMFG